MRIADIIRRSRGYRWAGIYQINGEDIADCKGGFHKHYLASGAGEWATENFAPSVLRRNSC